MPEDQDCHRDGEGNSRQWRGNDTLTSWAFTGLVAATLRAGRVVEKERWGRRGALDGIAFARDFLNIVRGGGERDKQSANELWLPAGHDTACA